MRLSDPQIRKALTEAGVELEPGVRLSELTSLGIGGTTDLMRIMRHD